MLGKKFLDKYAKSIIIFLSVGWIIAGSIGIVSTYRLARDWRDFHISKLTSDKALNAGMAIKGTNSSDRSTIEDIRLAGLDRSPYLFDRNLALTNILFMVTVITSFFVLYCVNQLDLKKKKTKT